MKTNIGTIDRVIRLIAGVVLITMALVSGFTVFDINVIRIVFVVIGAVLIVTALANFCPLYRLLGFRTNK